MKLEFKGKLKKDICYPSSHGQPTDTYCLDGEAGVDILGVLALLEGREITFIIEIEE